MNKETTTPIYWDRYLVYKTIMDIIRSYICSIGYNFYDNNLALEISLSKECKDYE